MSPPQKPVPFPAIVSAPRASNSWRLLHVAVTHLSVSHLSPLPRPTPAWSTCGARKGPGTCYKFFFFITLHGAWYIVAAISGMDE